MDIAERIEKRMKNYGYETMEEMIAAIEQQDSIDIGIFATPVGGQAENDKNIKLA